MTNAMNQTTNSPGSMPHNAAVPLTTRIIGYVEGVRYGNIIWPKAWPMQNGKFPKSHPVGGGFCDSGDGQCGNSEAMKLFRQRGYWASCFPEGDGITWKPLSGQSLEQVEADVKECFGWNVAERQP